MCIRIYTYSYINILEGSVIFMFKLYRLNWLQIQGIYVIFSSNWSRDPNHMGGKSHFHQFILIFFSDSTVGSRCSDAAGREWAEDKGERSCSGRQSSSSKSVRSVNARAAGISFHYNLFKIYFSHCSQFFLFDFMLYSNTTRGCLFYFSFTGSLQRLAPQDWCCRWGAVWYWP